LTLGDRRVGCFLELAINLKTAKALGVSALVFRLRGHRMLVRITPPWPKVSDTVRDGWNRIR